MKISTMGAAVFASAVTLSTLVTPHAEAATLTHDSASGTCTISLSPEEARKTERTSPDGIIATFLYEKAVGNESTKPAVEELERAVKARAAAQGDDVAFSDADEAVSRAFQSLEQRMTQAGLDLYVEGITESYPDGPTYRSNYAAKMVKNLIEIESQIEEDSGYSFTWTDSEKQEAPLEEVDAWYTDFDKTYEISSPELDAELTAYANSLRPQMEQLIVSMNSLYAKCPDKAPATVDLLTAGDDEPAPEKPGTDDSGTPGKTESAKANSSNSAAVVAVGVIATLVAVIGIFAAALPMIKPYLPAQVQTLIP